MTNFFLPLLGLVGIASAFVPTNVVPRPLSMESGTRLRMFNFGGSGGGASVPKNASDRDNKAIAAIRSTIASPRTPGFPLIEVEFPPLEALNKLGDGSLRSANQAEEANLAFAVKLAKSLSPVPFMGPDAIILTSSSASNAFLKAASKKAGGAATVLALRDGMPDDTAVTGDAVCILVTPSSAADYRAAEALATSGKTCVLVNGFAKDAKSVSAKATMAYFFKPLTYNSQVAGYLIRSYPSPWTTIDAATNQVLETADDNQILVRNTNTPDLRNSVKLVQKSFDERAIQARRG